MKYKNEKQIVCGIKFDSKKEAKRYGELLLLENVGKIKNLVLQPEFKFEVNGKPLKANDKGARQLKYIADFQYYDHEKEQVVVEDVKGNATAKLSVFRYKKALMWTLYGIDIFVV